MSGALRFARAGEEAALRALWQRVFGDTDAFLDDFFALIYRPGMAAVAEEDNSIVAAAYALPFVNARYIYAVATDPRYRGRGWGRQVTLLAAGGQPAYLYPADERLRRWYRDTMGAQDVCRRPRTDAPFPRQPIPAQEYATARETLLSGVPHAVYPGNILDFFARDGGFYRTAEGICAVGGDGRVREALPGEGEGAYVMGLNAAPPLHWGLVLD